MFLDPYLNILSKCFKTFKPSKKRQKIVSQAQGRIKADLNIVEIIRKVKFSYDILSKLLNDNQLKLMKFSKNSVLNLDSFSDQPDTQEDAPDLDGAINKSVYACLGLNPKRA